MRASLLSYVLPGLGQLAMGRMRTAALFLVPSLIGLGWIAIQVAQGLDWFGLSLFDDTFVVTLVGIVVVLGVIRILSVGHAFLRAPGRKRFRKLETAVMAALVISILATHAAVVGGAWLAYHTGAAWNENDMLSDVSLVNPEDTSPIETPDYGSIVPGGTLGATVTPGPTAWVNPDRICFLLIGVDFMEGRSHKLTDTMILATLDVHTNKATLISIPRDTANFDLYYGGWVGPTFRLNQLMQAASNPKFGSPDTGIKTLEKEIGFLVGLPVDYYAAVDLSGFVTIVEALGGVDVNVKTALNDPSTGTFVPVGLIHMDGHLALKYARSRESTSDYSRARRQQELLIALARKVITPEIVPQLGSILPLAWSTIATDFPMKYARNFITAFRRVKDPVQCVLGPPYSYHPNPSTTGGSWTTRLDISRVANLSVSLFGRESLYYNRPGVRPTACES